MISKSEADRTDRVRNQGREDGLFRSCMDQIRSSHTVGQTLRTAAIAAGLLTDAKCYAELLGQFYLATAALERRMEELLAEEDDVLQKHVNGNNNAESSALLVTKVVQKLGYSFTIGYERDLHALLGSDWKGKIESWTTEPAKRYIHRLESASDLECVAAAFILHGPLIIGGGAAIKPRVEKAFGEDATNVFNDVIGNARGGRSSRRGEFIQVYDTLLDDEDSNESKCDGKDHDTRFTTIVQTCGEFMRLNNEMMQAVRMVPWWRKYAAVGVIAAASALVWKLNSTDTAQSFSTRTKLVV